MASNFERLDAEAERLVADAEAAGRAIGYPGGGLAALQVLTEALAKAMVEAANFRDDPMRLPIIIQDGYRAVSVAAQRQAALRKGKPRGIIIPR